MNTAHLALDIYRTQATHTYIDFFFFFLFFLLLFFLLRVAHYVTVRDTYGCVSCVLATTHSQRVSCLCHICTRHRIEVSVPDWDRSDIRADGANPFTNKFFPPWCVLLRSRLGSEKKKRGDLKNFVPLFSSSSSVLLSNPIGAPSPMEALLYFIYWKEEEEERSSFGFFSIFSRERGKNMIVKIHPISLWAEKRKILGPLFFYFSLEI